MKKILLIFLSIFLICSFCSKESPAPDVEDNITLEITVTENGVPKAGIYVNVTALVRVFSHSRGEGSNVVGEYFNEAQDTEILTNMYGKSIFRYEDASVPEHDGIVIQKVVLSQANDVLLEDDEEKIIKKNGSLELDYDIGG